MTNSPFSNEAIKERLFDRRNIEPLEHLIDENCRRVSEMRVPAYDETADRIPTAKEVREKIFPEVKKEVSKILDFNEDISLPIKYGPTSDFLLSLSKNDGVYNLFFFSLNEFGIHYLYESKRILCRRKHISGVVGILAHEYSHAIEDVLTQEMLDSDELCALVECEKGKEISLFKEGTSCGVEAKVTERLSSQFDKESSRIKVLYEGLSLHTMRLLRAYLIMCQHANITPKDVVPFSVEKCPSKDFPKKFNRYIKDPYALGTAFFALSELKHGPSVYARALRRDEKILELH